MILIAGAVLAIGLGLRTVTSPESVLQSCDGRAYHLLAVSWTSGHGFFLDDPYLAQVCRGVTAGPSNHYSPGMPIVEGLFVLALGDTGLAVVLPVLLLSWAAVIAVWLTTRDLYGEPAGLLVAAATSIEWSGVFFGAWFGYAENLVLIGIVLTLWAVLRGLRDERFMVLAGLFAAVGYLSKASIGWFFLIAGVGGVLWRLWFRGWGVIRSPWYGLAVVIFAVPVVLWSARNLAEFWDGTPSGLIGAWQTSQIFANYVAAALADPVGLVTGLVGKLPILVLGLAAPLVPVLRTLRARLRRWREEEPLGLLLTAGLVFGLGWFFAAVTWLNEGSSLIWPDPLRYTAPAQIPLLWLLVRERPLPSTRAWVLMYVAIGVLFVFLSWLQIGNVPPPD